MAAYVLLSELRLRKVNMHLIPGRILEMYGYVNVYTNIIHVSGNCPLKGYVILKIPQ